MLFVHSPIFVAANSFNYILESYPRSNIRAFVDFLFEIFFKKETKYKLMICINYNLTHRSLIE